MDTRRCASKDVGPRRRVDWGEGGSHIELRREQVLARTLGPKGVDVEIPHQLGTRMKDSLNVVESGERNILYNGLETSP